MFENVQFIYTMLVCIQVTLLSIDLKILDYHIIIIAKLSLHCIGNLWISRVVLKVLQHNRDAVDNLVCRQITMRVQN